MWLRACACAPSRPLSRLPCRSHVLPFLLSGDPAETDYTAVGCAVTTISSNLTEMSRGVKLLAALLEDEGSSGRPLLQAAKGLAGAVSELLRSAQPASAEVRGLRVEPGRTGFEPREEGTVLVPGWTWGESCRTHGQVGRDWAASDWCSLSTAPSEPAASSWERGPGQWGAVAANWGKRY